MEIELTFTRGVQSGGDLVRSANPEHYSRRELENMGIYGINGGLFAVGRNSDGFVIQLARIKFDTEDLMTGLDDDLKSIKAQAENFFGLGK